MKKKMFNDREEEIVSNVIVGIITLTVLTLLIIAIL
tara:strand:- start:368 stop:475 length:108 start_codon:yes stop_codon:yes gene_type:complete